MSTTAPPGNSSQYVDFDEYVEFQLEKTRTSIRWADLLTAGAAVLAGFLGYLFVFVVLDQWVVPGGFSPVARGALLLLWLVGTGAWLFVKLVQPWLMRINRLYAARELERAEPGLHSSLLNLIDLRDAGRPVNPAVLKSLQRQAAVRLSEMDLNEAVDHRSLLRASYALLIVVVSLCLYALLSPKKISTSLWRVLPTSNVAAATRTEILSVTPGDTSATAELPVEVAVELRGQLPAEALVLYSTADEKYLDQPVVLRPEQEGSGRYTGSIWGENGKGVLQDFTYRVEAGDAVSETFRVTVEQPPSATIEQLRLEFPPYMQLEPQELSGGNIDSWEGAKVVLEARTNRDVRSAKIEFRDKPNGGPNGIELPLHIVEGRQLRGEWPLTLPASGEAAGYYCIRCLTEGGLTEKDPTVYSVKVRPDQGPEVVLVLPERDLEAPANAVIPLIVQAKDPDFQLGPIRLQLEKGGEVIHVQPLSPGGRPQTILRSELNLEPLGLMPGDTVALWVEATDNREPRPNRKNTPKLRITVSKPVSDEEVRQQLAEEKKKQEERLADASAEQNRDTRDGAPQEPSDSDPSQPMPQEAAPGDQRPPAEPPRNRDAARQPEGAADGSNEEPHAGKPGEAASGKPSPSEAAGDRGEGRPPLSPMGGNDEEVLQLLNDELNKQPRDEPSKPKDDEQTPQAPSAGKKPTPADGNSGDTGDQPQAGDQQPMPGQEQKPGDKGAGNERTVKQPGTESGASGEKSPDRKGTDQPSEGTRRQPGAETSDSEKPGIGPNERPKPGAGKTPGEKRPEGTEKPAETDPGGEKSEKPSDQPGGRPGEKQEAKPGDKPDGQSEKPPGGAGDKNSPMDIPKGEQPGQPGGKPGDQGGTEGMKPGQGTAGDKPGTAAEPGDNPTDAPKGTGAPGDGDKEPGGKGEATDKPAPGQRPGTPQEQPGQGSGAKPMPGEGDPTGAKPTDGVREQSGRKEPGRTANNQEPTGRESKPGRNGERQEARPKASEKPQAPASDGARGEAGRDPGSPGSPTGDQGAGAGESSSKPGGRQNGKTEQQSGAGKPGSESRPTKPGERGEPKPGEGQAEGNEPADTGKPGTPSKPDGSGKPEPGQPGDDSGQPGQPERSPLPGDGKTADGQGQPRSGDKPAGDQPGGDPAGNKPAEGDSKGGGKEAGGGQQPGGQEAGGEGGGKPGNQPGGKGGEGPVNGNPAGGGKGGAGSTGPSNGPEVAAGDAPDPDYNRQAAELVLRKLQDDLERGKVNPDLLEKLGWTEDQLRSWSDRLAKQLQQQPAETPLDRARQIQFEEMLRQIDLRKANVARSGVDQPIRELPQSDSRRSAPPAEYREYVEAFTRGLSKRKSASPKTPQK